MDHRIAALKLLPERALMRANGPLYRQLADILREPIESGAYPIGQELPKEADIAERFGISLITVRQALRDLETDGLIRKRSAKPAVVAARTPPLSLAWRFNNFSDMAAFTKDSELRIQSYRKETSPFLHRHFDMGRDEPGYCLRSVLAVGTQKRAHVTTYFPPDIGGRLSREDFTDVLIFRSVQNRLGIRMAVARITVRAEVADAALAADLDVEEGGPIMTVEMLYQTADQRNVEFSVARHPAHLFSITYDVADDPA